MMPKIIAGEKWKQVIIEGDYTNKLKLEVSNFGRLRTSSEQSNSNIIKGSTTSGYNIYRTRFFLPRNENVQRKFDKAKNAILKIEKELVELSKHKHTKSKIKELQDLVVAMKTKHSTGILADVKKRTVHYHALIHRLVAVYFLHKPSSQKTIVAHLDYNKANNHISNLKWMTTQENVAHQQNSPAVIEYRKNSKLGLVKNTPGKLTVTKVMLLKKHINEQKPMSWLVKQYKVTDVQIYRIKRGENWANIPAAL